MTAASRPTVLLAWELGDGMGHVGRLLPIADRLAALGYRPVFAVRDVAGTLQRIGAADYPVLQAPFVAAVRAGEGGFFARNFADILGVIGFGEVERVRVITRVWRSVVDLVRPAVVIADFSPMLTLALGGDDVPVLAVGSGFAVPPSHLASFPEVNPSGRSIVTEAELLEAANRLLRSEGRASAASLPALVGGDAQAVCTWSMLDPYADHRTEPGLGPIDVTPPARPAPKGEPSWFAYVAADSPMAKPLIDGLLAAKTRGSAFIRKADDALEARFRSAGHVLHRKVPTLEAMLATSSMIIHHGGINTAECALAMGVPQLVVSRHLEQHLTGDSLRRIGAGSTVRGRFEPADLARLIDRLVRNPRMAQAAAKAAAGIESRRGALDIVVQRALDLAARRRAAA